MVDITLAVAEQAVGELLEIEQDAVAAHLARGFTNHGKALPLH